MRVKKLVYLSIISTSILSMTLANAIPRKLFRCATDIICTQGRCSMMNGDPQYFQPDTQAFQGQYRLKEVSISKANIHGKDYSIGYCGYDSISSKQTASFKTQNTYWPEPYTKESGGWRVSRFSATCDRKSSSDPYLCDFEISHQ